MRHVLLEKIALSQIGMSGILTGVGFLSSTSPGSVSSNLDTSQVVRLVLQVIGLFSVLFMVVFAYQYYTSSKLATNDKTYKFNNPKAGASYVLDASQVNDISKGTFTLTNYIYIEGSQEMRSNPQAIWTWGVLDPVRRVFPSMMVSYIPAQEQLLFEFAHVPTGDENRVSVLHVPNIVQNRWFHITIISEGRTIDIYVNGVHSKSIQLPNILKQAGEGIRVITNSGILGSTTKWTIREGRLTDDAVKREYRRTSDKLGAPLVPFEMPLLTAINWQSFSLCPGMPWCEEVKGCSKTYVEYEYA